MTRPRPSTILFVPCFNEEGRIGSLLERIARQCDLIDEVLLVDDGSTDGSLDEVRSSGVECTVLRHRRRSGLGEGFRTAYRHTLARGHRVFCVMAGNGKDDGVFELTLDRFRHYYQLISWVEMPEGDD